MLGGRDDALRRRLGRQCPRITLCVTRIGSAAKIRRTMGKVLEGRPRVFPSLRKLSAANVLPMRA